MQLTINELQVCQMGGADGPIADRWVESGAQTGKLKPHLLTRQHTHIQVVSVTTTLYTVHLAFAVGIFIPCVVDSQNVL